MSTQQQQIKPDIFFCKINIYHCLFEKAAPQNLYNLQSRGWKSDELGWEVRHNSPHGRNLRSQPRSEMRSACLQLLFLLALAFSGSTSSSLRKSKHSSALYNQHSSSSPRLSTQSFFYICDVTVLCEFGAIQFRSCFPFSSFAFCKHCRRFSSFGFVPCREKSPSHCRRIASNEQLAFVLQLHNSKVAKNVLK